MDLLNNVIAYIINPLIYLLIGVTVLYFLWGVLVFVRNADKPEERATGARHILWGVIGIAIVYSVFIFVRIISNTIGSSGNPNDTFPTSLP